jgi:iron complex outermembrane receptor protein
MISMNQIGRGVSRALAVSAITALSAGALPAQAQQQPAQQQASSDVQLQEVVVTGSLIRRTDFETPSPIQVVTAQDLQDSGFTSVSDVLRNLAANGQGTLSQSFNFAFAGGASGVALRGLTVGGTLTLIDSQRMVPYALSDDSQRNFVDVSNLPFNVIDSVEVLKDGASAQYGSDAIAGVVNVKLKRTFTGVTVTGEGGSSSKGDGSSEHLAAMAGIGDLVNDGYNAYLALEFRHQDQILVGNRSGAWTTNDWTPYGGADTRPGAYSPSFVPFPRLLGGYVLNPATNAVDATTNFLSPTGCLNFATYQANGCVYNTPEQIQPNTQNVNALGRLTKNLSSDWQAVFTGSLFQSDSEQVARYQRYNGLSGSSTVAYGPGVNPTFVNVSPIMLPVGAPNNPFNAPAPLVALFPQIGPATTSFHNDTYRFFSQLRGTAAGWDIDASAGWMYSKVDQLYTGAIDPTQLQIAALNGFNFATASGQQMEEAFALPTHTTDTNTMEVVDVHGSHTLAQLPGGDLSLAVGGGYNHLYKNSPAAPEAAAGLYPSINAAYVIGGQTNFNGYAEIDAPFFTGFELQLSGRYDKYNTYGSSTTPKIGLKWDVFRMLALRATYGKGFRAPNPAEAGNSAALFGGGPGNDAILCPNPNNALAGGNFPSQCNLGLAGLAVATRDLQPEKSTNYTAGFIFKPLSSTSISFDYWDIKVDQDIQSGTNLFFLSGGALGAGPIVRGSQEIQPFCNLPANQTCTPAQLVPMTTPVGVIAYQAFPYINATQTHVNGVDLDLLSKFDVGPGKITAQLNASYMFHYDFGIAGATYDLAGTHGPSIISGDTGNPKIRAVASVGWDQGPFNLTVSANYVGRFNLIDPTNGEPDCNTAMVFGGVYGGRWPNGTVPQSLLNQYCEVSSFTSIDLYTQYAITKKFSLHASALNVLGTEPPVDMTTYGSPANLPYNPAMHNAGAVGRYFTLGATYTW